MRKIRGLDEADHQQRDEPPAAQVLIRFMPGGRIVLYPIVFDRSQAVHCHAALQALVRPWAAQPARLAALCELDIQTLPAPTGATEGPRA